VIVNKIYIYSLYVLGLVLFIVGLFLPSDPMHPSFAVVGLAYLLLLKKLIKIIAVKYRQKNNVSKGC
jgi:hypothetical protein